MVKSSYSLSHGEGQSFWYKRKLNKGVSDTGGCVCVLPSLLGNYAERLQWPWAALLRNDGHTITTPIPIRRKNMFISDARSFWRFPPGSISWAKQNRPQTHFWFSKMTSLFEFGMSCQTRKKVVSYLSQYPPIIFSWRLSRPVPPIPLRIRRNCSAKRRVTPNSSNLIEINGDSSQNSHLWKYIFYKYLAKLYNCWNNKTTNHILIRSLSLQHNHCSPLNTYKTWICSLSPQMGKIFRSIQSTHKFLTKYEWNMNR